MGILDVLGELADDVPDAFSDAVADAGKIEQVAAQLDGARSIVIEVDNHTSLTLTRQPQSDHFDSGGFGVLPEDEIPPHTADIFGAVSKSAGAIGSVTYALAAAFWLVGFADPVLGGNTGNTVLSGAGSITSRFRVTCLIGAGTSGAHARFSVYRHAPYSLTDWMHRHHIPMRDTSQQPPGLTNDGLLTALPRGGLDRPPSGTPWNLRDLLLLDGDQAATSED
jgi:hypothetical protein